MQNAFEPKPKAGVPVSSRILTVTECWQRYQQGHQHDETLEFWGNARPPHRLRTFRKN